MTSFVTTLSHLFEIFPKVNSVSVFGINEPLTSPLTFKSLKAISPI